MDDYLVLIVGCGQLGSRHLQAVSSIPNVREVEIVDPNPESLELGRQRLKEVINTEQSITFRWLTSLSEATPGGDISIVATQATGRCQLMQNIVNKLGYSVFIIEKLVGQSTDEVSDLINFGHNRGLKIWVNCPSRGYPIHQRIKGLLDPGQPIYFSVTGGNFGLANNGIHHADLFAFLDGSELIDPVSAFIDPVLHPSKRNNNLYDLSGALHATTRTNSRFSLTYSGEHANWEHIQIGTNNYRWLVDHLKQQLFESSYETDWRWERLEFEESILVSDLTKRFVTDILSSGSCDLPTLEESLISHKYILEELRPTFRALLDENLNLCPVT